MQIPIAMLMPTGKKLCLTTMFLVFTVVVSYSQKTENHWAFGYKGLVSFNSGVPELTGKSTLTSSEGTATVSSAGNLLFYTDGDKVYNSDHELMVNGTELAGIAGAKNSSQGALIIKKYGVSSLYYIFSPSPVEAWEHHFYYHVIDINAQSGRGEVIEKKNILINDNCTEKVAAVSHVNGADM